MDELRRLSFPCTSFKTRAKKGEKRPNRSGVDVFAIGLAGNATAFLVFAVETAAPPQQKMKIAEAAHSLLMSKQNCTNRDPARLTAS